MLCEHCACQGPARVSLASPTPCYSTGVFALALQDNLLYTLTVQCPQSRWAEDGEVLKQAAASLQVKPSGSRQYPGALS